MISCLRILIYNYFSGACNSTSLLLCRPHRISIISKLCDIIDHIIMSCTLLFYSRNVNLYVLICFIVKYENKIEIEIEIVYCPPGWLRRGNIAWFQRMSIMNKWTESFRLKKAVVINNWLVRFHGVYTCSTIDINCTIDP